MQNDLTVKIVEVVPLDKKREKIILESGEIFALYKGEVRRFQLENGAQIPMETIRQIYEEILKKRVKERSLYLLKSMDRTEWQIRRKLAQGYYPEQVIDYAIDFLKEYGYVDDRSYVQNYMNTYKNRKSQKEIRQKLREKGISAELLEEVAEEMTEETGEDEGEQVLIRQWLQKKGYRPDWDRKEQNRLIAFLMRKGFSLDDIYYCMREND